MNITLNLTLHIHLVMCSNFVGGILVFKLFIYKDKTMSKEMRKHIYSFNNFSLKEGKLDDMISKSEKSNKESCLRTILNRDNLMLNKYDKIEWDSDILKISISYFDYGQGTKILSFLKHRSFFFDYWVDFKNKKLYNKNMLGGTYDLTDDELEKISNKYYWFKE